MDDQDEFVVLRIDVSEGDGYETRASTLSADDGGDGANVRVETLGATEAAATDQQGVLSAARNMPFMLVEPMEATESLEPYGTSADATWGLEAVGALSSERTGKGVKVAILDTGINADHEAFKGKTIVQEDFTGEGNGDEHGHGTHCAGTVCGGSVGGMRIGVAPGVQELLIGKVLNKKGGGSTAQIVKGLQWAAEQGAHVISVSLGIDFPGMLQRLKLLHPDKVATSIALDAYRQNVRLFDAVAELIRKRSAMFSRCIVIAAAGNESRRPDFELGVAPPAVADGFISVGAVGRSNGATSGLVIAPFSNTGPLVVAPGVGVLSAAHDSNTGLRSLDGTSMATPHVAGVTALWAEDLMEDGPDFPIEALRGKLTALANKRMIDSDVPAKARGVGVVQAPS